ncbi:MAG: hypothetical protein WCR04_12110, partial [Fibrobacteraceae bacterium]
VSAMQKQAFALHSTFATVVTQRWPRALKPRISGSELVHYHDRGGEADAEGINTASIGHYSFLLPQGSFSLRSKLLSVHVSCSVLDNFTSPKQFLEIP